MIAAAMALCEAARDGYRAGYRRWCIEPYRTDRSPTAVPADLIWFGIGPVTYDGAVVGVSLRGPRRGLAIFQLPDEVEHP